MKIIPPIETTTFFHSNLDDWLTNNMQNNWHWCHNFRYWRIIFAIACWSLWNQRNRLVFGCTPWSIDEMEHAIFRMVDYTFKAITITVMMKERSCKKNGKICWLVYSR